MSLISLKLRNSARGQVCTFQIPGICNSDTETTCFCHAPSEVKGMGNKSPDFWGAFGCYACHEHLDQRRLPKIEELEYWMRGIFRTQKIWVAKGLVLLPVDPATAKKRTKKTSYWASRPMQSRNTLSRKKKERADDDD